MVQSEAAYPSTPDMEMSNLTLEETETLSETSDWTAFSGAPAEDEQIVNTALGIFLIAVTMDQISMGLSVTPTAILT